MQNVVIVEDGPTSEESLVAQAGAKDEIIDGLMGAMRKVCGKTDLPETD